MRARVTNTLVSFEDQVLLPRRLMEWEDGFRFPGTADDLTPPSVTSDEPAVNLSGTWVCESDHLPMRLEQLLIVSPPLRGLRIDHLIRAPVAETARSDREAGSDAPSDPDRRQVVLRHRSRAGSLARLRNPNMVSGATA